MAFFHIGPASDEPPTCEKLTGTPRSVLPASEMGMPLGFAPAIIDAATSSGV